MSEPPPAATPPPPEADPAPMAAPPTPAADVPAAVTPKAEPVTAERRKIHSRHSLILIALIPAMAVACAMFGWRPAVNFVITWLTAMVAGTLFKKLMHTPPEPSGYRFARALCSILLIGCLPPNLPWWGALAGGVALDASSRLTAHVPKWTRWFRHISPVVPALLMLYLLGPVILPGVLYQNQYPVLVAYPLPFDSLVDPNIDAMLRDPQADSQLPPFTWDIESSLPRSQYNEELVKGNLPRVDAISQASPMAIVRCKEPGHADPELSATGFDVLDGFLGYQSGATLEVHALALLAGILLLCLNRILAWRFVVGALVGALCCGFMTGAVGEVGLLARTAHGAEHIVMGGLLLSLFLFAHPTALPVSATASYLQGVLLSVLMVLFRRILWQTAWQVHDATLIAILISALLLPSLESFTRRHLVTGPPTPQPKP